MDLYQININRGIKQGCPLSALLFIIVVEILALKIKQINDIKGITVKRHNHEQEIKISQYADDGALFLRDLNEIDKAINEIHQFGEVTGLKLNTDKTIGIHLGISRGATWKNQRD